ncbi:hypothetical protein [Acidovorax sp. A1169]|uniref:head-tail joining protein n=1 Tax=Acidovorax sp. A1169 TaxID=3059524 RepID=UPI002737E297|nr:hypothetical protein [Acidovorax sp. A1169]MDP4074204.1 hypothetical protein [Acidovorax sp. A1169]
MSLNPFAALEARVNSTVQARLSNAIAVYQGGAEFGVIFERAVADPLTGAVDTAQHTCSFCIANTPGLHEGSELVINGTTYVVATGVQPDAGGWVDLDIYPKAG